MHINIYLNIHVYKCIYTYIYIYTHTYSHTAPAGVVTTDQENISNVSVFSSLFIKRLFILNLALAYI